jgi:hypothetical protein
MRIAITLLLAMVLGCASIVSKSTYPITFDSNPTGAHIIVSNSSGVRMYEGRTPTTLTLSAKKGFFQGQDYTIEATLDGHNPGRATLNSGLDGWYIGNILFGGLIGMLIIDPATGAMWKLDERIVVNLGRSAASHESGEASIEVVALDQLAPELRRYLVPVN